MTSKVSCQLDNFSKAIPQTLCCFSHGSNRHSASRSPSATAKLLLILDDAMSMQCMLLRLENTNVNIQEAQLLPREPHDASCQLKSCQLPRNSAETTYTTSPDRIDGMKLEI